MMTGRSTVKILRHMIYLFLSHRFNSWITDLLLSEDLGEITQEGRHHEFKQWKKEKSGSQGLFSSYNVCNIIMID